MAKDKLLIVVIALLFAFIGCSKPTKHINNYYKYDEINSNAKWITYKLNDTHYLCVPNSGADKGALPVILEIKK